MTAKAPNTSALTSNTQNETTDRVTFDSITDSKGNLVPKNTVTYDPILELKGKADAGRMLKIRDRFNPISDVETLPSGIWIKRLNFSHQEFKPFSLNVIEKDPPQNSSTPYDFIWATETPIIKVVTGKDGPINDDDTYTGDSLEFSGYAPPDMEVEAFNDCTTTGKKINVNPDGFFKLTLDGLTDGTYKIKIKAANGKESDVFNFRVSVKEDVKLSLDDVLEFEGGPPVDEAGTTDKTPLFITGHARPGESIQLFNGSDPIEGAIATADLEFGVWKYTLDVTDGDYSLTAHANYGDNEISDPPRTFKVVETLRPTIESVTNRAGDPVSNGGSTPGGKLTIDGYGAAPDRRVTLLWNHNPVSNINASSKGTWQFVTNTPVTPGGPYTLRVRDADGQLSQYWSYHVTPV